MQSHCNMANRHCELPCALAEAVFEPLHNPPLAAVVILFTPQSNNRAGAVIMALALAGCVRVTRVVGSPILERALSQAESPCVLLVELPIIFNDLGLQPEVQQPTGGLFGTGVQHLLRWSACPTAGEQSLFVKISTPRLATSALTLVYAYPAAIALPRTALGGAS